MPIQIIVCDSSCVIPLRNESLLSAMVALGYECILSTLMFDFELREHGVNREGFCELGFKFVDLDEDIIRRASELATSHVHLSFQDRTIMLLAQSLPNAILLTGDMRLREAAERFNIEVHGVLWITDKIFDAELVAPDMLISALCSWLRGGDPYLPKEEVKRRINRYAEGVA